MAKTFDDYRDEDDDTVASYTERDKMFKELEKIFFMRWPEGEQVRNAIQSAMLTLSPDPRNQLIGAVRLMTATDPVFKVPGDEFGEFSTSLEEWCAANWQSAGRLAGSPIHYDLVMSALLYGEAHLAIKSTAEMSKLQKGRGDAYAKRVDKAARRTPYLYTALYPPSCYPKFDDLGLYCHVRECETTAERLINAYGKKAEDAMTAMGKSGKDKVTFRERWDLDKWLVYVVKSDVKIVDEDNSMGFIPIEACVTEGSYNLFSNTAEQRMPFLYGVYKSDMWGKQNLALTVMATMAFLIGANPMYVYKRADPSKELNIDVSKPGLVTIDQGEEFGPMNKAIIDPSIREVYAVASQSVVESTMYKQALGAPLGGSNYSYTALLSQSGRLPLVSPQKRLEWLIGSAMEKSLDWLRGDKEKKSKAYANGKPVEIDLEAIGEDVTITCKLSVKLPQEALQMAAIASSFRQGNPLMPDEWIVTEILGEEAPEKIKRKIWSEKAADAMAQVFMQQQIQGIVQQAQQQAQAQTAPPQGGGGAPPPPEELPGMGEGSEPPLEPMPNIPSMPSAMPGQAQGVEGLNV